MTIRRSPAEYYLRYLLSHPRRLSTPDICKRFAAEQLDYIGDEYVDALREELAMPPGFRPWSRSHSPTRRFLVRHRIYDLYHRSPAVEQALRILADPRGKQEMETLLLTAAPPAWCLERLRTLGHDVTVRALDKYAFYFFNLSLIDRRELRALMELRAPWVDSEEPGDAAQRARAVRNANRSDPRAIAVNTGVVEVSLLVEKLRAGVLPSNVDVANMAQALRAVALAKSIESIADGSDNAHERALSFARIIPIMNDTLEAIGEGGGDLYAELEAFAIRVDKPNTKSLQELSGGEHTLTLHPEEETKHEAESRGA